MRKYRAWAVVLILTFGFLMLAAGYFLGRNSGTTVIYQRPVKQHFEEESSIVQTEPVSEPAEPTGVTTEPNKINLNTADQALLETLPQIGPVLAQRIVEYRQTYGPFRTIDQIKDVDGIGTATFAEIEPWITVGE